MILTNKIILLKNTIRVAYFNKLYYLCNVKLKLLRVMKTSKKDELLQKEFKVNEDFSVARGDYESLPCPMLAWTWTDAQMEALAKNIAEELKQYSYDENDIEDQKEDAFWREMENCAVSMGMEYYEDMTDEEYNRYEMEWQNLKL